MRMIGGVVLGMLENGSARESMLFFFFLPSHNCFVLIGGAVGRTVCSSNAFGTIRKIIEMVKVPSIELEEMRFCAERKILSEKISPKQSRGGGNSKCVN